MIPEPQSSRGNGGGVIPSPPPTNVQKGVPRGPADRAFGYWWGGTGGRGGLEVETEWARENDLVGSGERWDRRGGRLCGRRCGRCVSACSARGKDWARHNRGRAGASPGERPG